MFTLPGFTLAPILNGFGAFVLPTIDGALYGWFLIAALVVTAFGIARSMTSADVATPAVQRPAEPRRDNLVTIDLPRHAAA